MINAFDSDRTTNSNVRKSLSEIVKLSNCPKSVKAAAASSLLFAACSKTNQHSLLHLCCADVAQLKKDVMQRHTTGRYRLKHAKCNVSMCAVLTDCSMTSQLTPTPSADKAIFWLTG